MIYFIRFFLFFTILKSLLCFESSVTVKFILLNESCGLLEFITTYVFLLVKN